MESQQEQKKSWFSRNKTWALPTGGCLVVLIIVAIFVFSLIGGVTTLFKNSEPYQYAIQQAQESEWVISKIGQPIESDGMTTGNVNFTNGNGTAELSIPIKGNKDEATILVIANKTGEAWDYTTLTVTVDDTEEVHNLLNSDLLPIEEE